MKRYIKPNTELHAVELQQMIAESVKLNNTAPAITNDTTGWTDLGKEGTTSSNSIWDEEE